jgi:hypothetical protein
MKKENEESKRGKSWTETTDQPKIFKNANAWLNFEMPRQRDLLTNKKGKWWTTQNIKAK